MSECCDGSGYADYAAVPCPNPDCPVPIDPAPDDEDPATALRSVAATEKLLALHERWEIPENEFTGNYVERIENGRTIRHWPPGSITGQRQVGVHYDCGHCMHPDESQMKYPCPTVRIEAERWGVTSE